MGNMWAVTVTIDQPTIDRLDWMRKNTGVTRSAAIRLSVEERYRLSKGTDDFITAAQTSRLET